MCRCRRRGGLVGRRGGLSDKMGCKEELGIYLYREKEEKGF